MFGVAHPDLVLTLPCQYNIETEGHSYLSHVVLRQDPTACLKLTTDNWQHCKASPEILHFNVAHKTEEAVVRDFGLIEALGGTRESLSPERLRYPLCGRRKFRCGDACCMRQWECDTNAHDFGVTVEELAHVDETAQRDWKAWEDGIRAEGHERQQKGG